MKKKNLFFGILGVCMACSLSFGFSSCSKDKGESADSTAYQIWLDQGFVGTEEDFFAWLKKQSNIRTTEGLQYELIEGKDEYRVIGIGIATDTDVVIPSTFYDFPVTEIGARAFSNCMQLTSVVIPDSVKTLGHSAFEVCKNLTSATLPDSITTLPYGTFFRCNKLTTITIPDSITTIGNAVFYECTRLNSIVIGSGVKSVGDSAFYGCSNLSTVYYKGTASEWDEIQIGAYRPFLTSALRYYYIENEADVPTDDNKYWHYVEGVPTAW